MKKQKIPSERAFQRDKKLSMTQRMGWLVTAAVALAGAYLIARFLPQNLATYFALALALGAMLLYRWFSGAPLRAINEYTRRLAESSSREVSVEFLEFLVKLEPRLPTMRRKELAFTIMYLKALLLHSLGENEEALKLLRGFTRLWDPRQKERVDQLIAKITGETQPSSDKE